MIWSRYNISPLSHVLVVFTLFFMLSCAESPEEDSASQENAVEDANLDVGDTKRALLVESIIRSSPTVSETSEIFAVLGSSFNREYLNDIQNISKYTTLKDMGINLGVYLADIGYVSTFEQSQEVLFYMNSAKKMAEGIGVSDVFDEGTVERMEMNINDKDSVLDIISDLYWKTDGFLKELDRQNISALIICGGWVEGMYIGGRILNDDFDSDIVYARYKDQRKNLKKILRLLDTFEGEENLDYFKQKLSDIDKDYESMPQPEVIIETNDVTDAEKEVLGRISMKILDIRKEICLL
ncbi:MAG: hypothetical protein RIC15_01890 [Vicingaceae bacterium]